MQPISRREWFFPLGVGLLFVLVGSLPYVYALSITPDNETFMGFVGRDTTGANSYLAFARQAAEGRAGITNLYTSESPSHAYYNPEWWLVGKLTTRTGLSLMAVFHLGRALTALAFVVAVYYLVAVLLQSGTRRRATLLLICCGTGLGWLPYGLNLLFQTNMPLSLDVGGVNIFGYLMNKPHFMRAGVFAALQYAWFIRGDQTGRNGFFAASGCAAAAHSLIRPYHIPEALLFLVLYAMHHAWRAPAFARKRSMQAALCGLCHAPVILWYAIVFLKNPLGLGPFVAWAPQYLLSQLLWLGLPFAMVLGYGLYRLCRTPLSAITVPILALWMIAAFLLLQAYPYFPWAVESYFPWIFAPPLLFVRFVWPRMGRQSHRSRHLAIMAIMVAVLPCSALTYARFFTDLRAPRPPERYYLHNDLHDAIDWLAQNAAENDVVLASHDTSQFIPRLAQVRVVSGQDALTADYRQKNAHVLRFFQTPGDDEGFKQWFCREQGVTFILVGPEEQAIAVHPFTPFPWMEPVFENDRVTLYKL